MKANLFFLAFFLNFIAFGQNLPSAQLPPPGQFSINYLKSLGQKNILWGATPPNFNGKVILFNHGYIASTETLLIANTMYDNAYNNGYKTAFVATTRGQGDWVNGEILSRAMNQVATQFGVASFDMIVHSNGGKASEVAMFNHNKRDLVNKVITLGTPFRGTVLANISQMWWFNWVWEYTGLNTGAATSTTYYCDNYFRPFFDNHPLNQPKKFYNYGAWGWNQGHTIFRPILTISGGLIYLFGGGPNDGVTSFYSSIRPNGNQLYPLGDAQGKFDHIDLMYGQLTWNNCFSVLKSNQPVSSRYENDNNNSNIDLESNEKEIVFKEVSNYQVISSENEYDEIIIDKEAKNLHFEIFHQDENAFFEIFESGTNKEVAKFSSNQSIRNEKLKEDDTYKIQKHVTSYDFKTEGLEKLKIKSGSTFAIGVTQDIHKPIEYEFVKKGNNYFVQVSAPNIGDENIEVTAVADLTNDIMGEEIPSVTQTLTFRKVDSKFIADISYLDNGTYSLFITVKKGKDYKRNLISGFVIGNPTANINNGNQVNDSFTATLSSNPVNENTFLKINGVLDNNYEIKIYDTTGSLKSGFIFNNEEGIEFPIGKKTYNLLSGIYFITIKSNNKIKTIKFIKQTN